MKNKLRNVMLLFLVLAVVLPFASHKAEAAETTVTMVSSDFEIYSNDGKQFLGTLSTNTFDSDSIFNKFGVYGSKFSATSIWNSFGNYGSKFMMSSAFNPYSYSPPIIVYNGKAIAYVSVNKYLSGAISPYQLWNEAKAIDGLY